MAHTYFRFKKFCVWHDRCAMKVGTDGTLLGAWVSLDGARRVLDVGTGSGLIALMCAQRLDEKECHFHIDALDIDSGAVEQAQFNVSASPWKERIAVFQEDILTYQPSCRYEVIVCNPPFFLHSLQCPDPSRNAARHAAGMPFEDLLCHIPQLLTDTGTFSVVLPADAASMFIREAVGNGLYLQHVTYVHTLGSQPPKRVLMAFSRSVCADTVRDDLVIECERGVFSEPYKALTREFYLKF